MLPASLSISSLVKSRLVQLLLQPMQQQGLQLDSLSCRCPRIQFQAHMADWWFGPPRLCPCEGLQSEPKSAHIWNGEVTTLQKQGYIMESLALVMTEDISATNLNRKTGKWQPRQLHEMSNFLGTSRTNREEFEETGSTAIAGGGRTRDILF